LVFNAHLGISGIFQLPIEISTTGTILMKILTFKWQEATHILMVRYFGVREAQWNGARVNSTGTDEKKKLRVERLNRNNYVE